jgi:hypothetical protein
LHGELQRHVAGQAHLHAAVGQGFHEQKNVSWAAAAQPVCVQIFSSTVMPMRNC